MDANEIETLRHYSAGLELANSCLRDKVLELQTILANCKPNQKLLDKVLELQRVADAKPFELNQEMMDEIQALREHVTKLNGWLNHHESMLARSRREANNMRRRAALLRKGADGMRIERDLALAHDTQAYPTMDAYDNVCKALAKWEARAIDAVDLVEKLEGEVDHLQLTSGALRVIVQGYVGCHLAPADPDVMERGE